MCGQKYETKIGKAAQKRAKQERKNEKPKLNNARRLRGIYFIDPCDQDYEEHLKNPVRKLERSMAPAMPCKSMVHTSTTKVVAMQEIASQKNPQTIYGCTAEAHEFTRQRVKTSVPTKHEDRIAGKGFTSMTHYNFVHKFILMPQALKIPDSKSCSG